MKIQIYIFKYSLFSCKITIYKISCRLVDLLRKREDNIHYGFCKSLEKNWSNQKNRGLTAYLQKMKGEAREKDRIDYVDSFVSAIGGLIAIIIISFIAVYIGYPMALAPLGASCVIVFGAHKSLLSQPRNVIGGHIISTTSALIIWSIFGKSLFIIGLVLAIVLIIMTFTKTVYPPAAAMPLFLSILKLVGDS